MFNALDDITPESVGFEQMFVNLDKSLRILIFTKQDLSTNTEIFIDMLEKVEVSKHTKTIDTIHKVYKNFKKQLIDTDEYFNSVIEKENNTSTLLNEKYRYKCLSSNYYLVLLSLRTGIIVEVIFTSYQTFKDWTKGLDCILMHKAKLSLLKNRII